jgi:hypothetical protein
VGLLCFVFQLFSPGPEAAQGCIPVQNQQKKTKQVAATVPPPNFTFYLPSSSGK